VPHHEIVVSADAFLQRHELKWVPNCGGKSNSIGFVFVGGVTDRDHLCDDLGWLIGQSAGLSGTFACGDVMGAPQCNPKSFVDAQLSCEGPCVCSPNEESQNAHQTLLARYGERTCF